MGLEGRLTRRSLLATIGTGIGATTVGCLSSNGSTDDDSPTPVALTIKTLPADDDPPAASIGRRLTEHLAEVGADAQLEPKTSAELYNDVLIEHDFDLFVTKFPPMEDPDVLRPLLHSTFDHERGWQNPFGLADAHIDELLEAQLTADRDDRPAIVDELQTAIVDAHPFSVVAFPEELTAVGLHLDPGLRPTGLSNSSDILYLGNDDRLPIYRVGILDGRITTDLNPLRPEFPNQRLILGLVYDTLGLRVGSAVQPWLADAWHWGGSPSQPHLDVELREPVNWHDGNPLTVDDVAFTYRFLSDLSLGTADEPIPAPRFRGRTSLIDTVSIRDDSAIRFRFDGVAPVAAVRALTVPILPRHIWQERTDLDQNGLPDALTTTNEYPIGSGPFAFEVSEPHEILVLDRNSGHFAASEVDHEPIEPSPGRLAFDRLEFVIPTRPPTVGSGVNMIVEGDLDTLIHVPAHQAATVTRADDVILAVRPTAEPYVIGFNLRREPCSAVGFRRIVGRLIDRTFTVASAFRGYAEPANSPLAATGFLSPDLLWDGESVLGPFPGASGLLDVEQARMLFRDVGFVIEDDVLVAGSAVDGSA